MIYAVFGVVSTLICLLFWYYRRHQHDTPTLHHADSDLHRHILKSKPRFTSPYRMPFWLQNTHVHTVVSCLMTFPRVTFNRENMTMKDDGVIALDWVMDNVHTLSDSSPVLIILLTWTSHSKHAMGLCKAAAERGFRVVIFNKRGHGDLTLNTSKLQTMGDPSDFRECVEYIHEKFPKAHLFGHGSSAGCGTLISYVIKSQEKSLLTATVFVSPSYNVYRTFSEMSLFYRQVLLSNLKGIIWRHRNTLGTVVDVSSALLSFDFKDMDSNLYSKCYGYENVDDFRKDYDPLDNIHTVQTPGLCISSHDDPVCQTNTIPYHHFQDNDYPTRMLVTVRKGGHCGFFEGWFRLESWSDKLSLDYLEAVLEFTSEVESHFRISKVETCPELQGVCVQCLRSSRYHPVYVI